MDFQVAIKEKLLVHWEVDGFVRTLEPHMYAQIRGGDDVLIGLQIAGGPLAENTQEWKIVKMTAHVTVASKKRFASARIVPPHLMELVRVIYASTT